MTEFQPNALPLEHDRDWLTSASVVVRLADWITSLYACPHAATAIARLGKPDEKVQGKGQDALALSRAAV